MSALKSGYASRLTIGYDSGAIAKLYSQEIQTPVGVLRVAGSSAGVCRICFPRVRLDKWLSWFDRYYPERPIAGSQPLLKRVVQQLNEYFQGQRSHFGVPLDLKGTPFQLRIWEELMRISYGTTVSYGEIASRVDRTGGGQAVGFAVGSNPVPIVVPCHRVIGHDGSLVGFGGGLSIKQRLLELERSREPIRSRRKG